jgi:hypothetical protein
MPDHFFDELERWEVDLLDDISDSGIFQSLDNWQGYEPTRPQWDAARKYVAAQIARAQEMDMTLTTSRIRRGNVTVETTVLRDALGRFVRTGAANIRARLRE